MVCPPPLPIALSTGWDGGRAQKAVRTLSVRMSEERRGCNKTDSEKDESRILNCNSSSAAPFLLQERKQFACEKKTEDNSNVTPGFTKLVIMKTKTLSIKNIASKYCMKKL